MNKGVVYVATTRYTNEQTITEVSRSVRLLMKNSPDLPRTLVGSTDVLQNKKLTKFFTSIIVSQHPEFDGYMGSKIQALELSPYELTLILDNDTLPVRNITKGFDLIGPNKRDIALSIAPNQELKDDSGITNFQNGVMFVHRNERTIALFKTWMEQVKSEEVVGPTRFIFSKLLLNSPDISIYALSYFWNFRIDMLLDYDITLSVLRKILPRVRILHTHLKRGKALKIFKCHPEYEKFKKDLQL